MARRHWLDPLARRLLTATGQLPPSLRQPDGRRGPAGQRHPDPGDSSGHGGTHPDAEKQDSVELELMAIKLRQNPRCRFHNPDDLRLAAALGWRLDVNRATAEDWDRLPGLTAQQRDLLLRLQAGGVQLSGPDDLQHLLELDDSLLLSWLPVLDFRWYGQPATTVPEPTRMDINRATVNQLHQLGVSEERIQRLLRERARQPFRDLADLQARLQLPASVVEAWIGRVCFGQGPLGPMLPPGPKRP